MSWSTLGLETRGADQTQALAAALAGIAASGDLIVLAGEMGAGKTAFAQGFARGLGITETVTSPTFTLIREYPGPRLDLHHLDVYRLDNLREVDDLSLGEMLDEAAVMLVEWGDAVLPVLPEVYLEVSLRFPDLEDGNFDADTNTAIDDTSIDGTGSQLVEDHRLVELRGVGGAWVARRWAVVEAVTPWLHSDAEDNPSC